MALRTYAPYGGSKAVKRFLIGLFVVCKCQPTSFQQILTRFQAEQLLAIALTGVLVALTECELLYVNENFSLTDLFVVFS